MKLTNLLLESLGKKGRLKQNKNEREITTDTTEIQKTIQKL